MDEAIRKLAAIGLPAVILLIAMATTGLAGAAAITAALAMLGPGGMLGGILLLGIIGIAADVLAKYGIDKALTMIYETRKEKGEAVEALCKEVKKLPISTDLKRKLTDVIKG